MRALHQPVHLAELVELYRITEPYLTPLSNLQPRFNFAPTDTGPVLRLDREGRREPVMMRWGLVPSWAKDAKGGAAMINAKAESVTEKSAYRKAFVSRPCLVPADGFYEWKHGDLFTKVKTPYRFELATSEPFAFAGLWQDEEDQPGKTEPRRSTRRCTAFKKKPSHAVSSHERGAAPDSACQRARWWLRESG